MVHDQPLASVSTAQRCGVAQINDDVIALLRLLGPKAEFSWKSVCVGDARVYAPDTGGAQALLAARGAEHPWHDAIHLSIATSILIRQRLAPRQVTRAVASIERAVSEATAARPTHVSLSDLEACCGTECACATHGCGSTELPLACVGSAASQTRR